MGRSIPSWKRSRLDGNCQGRIVCRLAHVRAMPIAIAIAIEGMGEKSELAFSRGHGKAGIASVRDCVREESTAAIKEIIRGLVDEEHHDKFLQCIHNRVGNEYIERKRLSLWKERC